MLDGIGNGDAVSVSEFPVAWKIQAVSDPKYRGFEYIRYGMVPTTMALCH